MKIKTAISGLFLCRFCILKKDTDFVLFERRNGAVPDANKFVGFHRL